MSLIGMASATLFFLLWLKAERKLAKYNDSEIFKKEDSKNETRDYE